MSNRLPPEEYKALCRVVLRRDRWRCRCCLRRDCLHVHHIVYRSRGGLDTTENLITLCCGCHEKVHLHRIVILLLEGCAPGISYYPKGAGAPVTFEIVGLGKYLA